MLDLLLTFILVCKTALKRTIVKHLAIFKIVITYYIILNKAKFFVYLFNILLKIASIITT